MWLVKDWKEYHSEAVQIFYDCSHLLQYMTQLTSSLNDAIKYEGCMMPFTKCLDSKLNWYVARAVIPIAEEV